MSNRKVIIVHLIVGFIKKIWCDSNTLHCIKMTKFFAEPYESFSRYINVRVDLSNYATFFSVMVAWSGHVYLSPQVILIYIKNIS